MQQDITSILSQLAERFEQAADAMISTDDVPEALAEAMKYAIMGGGKRLRPAMVFLAAELVCGDSGDFKADPITAAVAIELVHGYSLVHDDLPAMDDDTLRRGRPTVHVQYGEAMGILVGDALLTRAFELLSTVRPAEVAAELAAELANGSGPAGMIAGQVADMALCKLPDGVEGLQYIHARKTAALFAAAARMGAICGGADRDQLRLLGEFAWSLGMAFQVRDDILDTTSTAEQLGKTPGKDSATGKRTYPALLGLDASEQIASQFSDRAANALEPFGERGEKLSQLAKYLLNRTK